MSPAPAGTASESTNVPRTAKIPKKIEFQSYLAAGLALLLVLELAGIGWYTYNRVQTLVQPENLGDRVEEAVRENYPEFRSSLVVRVKENAPELAQQVSKEILAAVPDARVDLERFAARQLSVGLDNATELSADRFAKVLEDNRERLVEVFETIDDAPEEAHRLMLETEADIESQLGVDIQRQARIALQRLDQLNAKLDRLADSPDDLSAKEQLERRIVRVLRALQQADDGQRVSANAQLRR